MLSYLVLLPLVLMLLRLPVALAMLAPSLVYIASEPRLNFGIVIQRTAGLLDSFPLLAVPMFILVGFIANEARLADRLIAALLAATGRVRGSIAYANVNASLVFSWMSGSAIADASALGSVVIPAMRRSGYRPGFAAAITAASATIGPVMPPSIPAVLDAVLTSTSVFSMFLAGIVPALLIFAGLSVYIFFYVRRVDLRETSDLNPDSRVKAMVAAAPILVAPVILLGGILTGRFTPTEASAVTSLYLLLIGVGLRWLSLAGIWRALSATISTLGRVMFIAAVGALYGYVLAREGVPSDVAAILKTITENPFLFLLMVNLALLLVGMFLEPTSALLVTVPVLFPIAQEFGVDPVHFGAIVILNLTIGLLTPPVGLVLYILGMVGDVRVSDIIASLWPMLIILLGVLVLITMFPAVPLIFL
ncbi:MAG: TRAP transporter large permease [Roseitalea porphyridii]|jgi:tripartite ATP-independent transporter DctM subunit|uniref:TRAP transporter large permease n=1 Tax=Roseitalea porphyridii TaxID=1852022 RepID=UPI0032EAFFFA